MPAMTLEEFTASAPAQKPAPRSMSLEEFQAVEAPVSAAPVMSPIKADMGTRAYTAPAPGDVSVGGMLEQPYRAAQEVGSGMMNTFKENIINPLSTGLAGYMELVKAGFDEGGVPLPEPIAAPIDDIASRLVATSVQKTPEQMAVEEALAQNPPANTAERITRAVAKPLVDPMTYIGAGGGATAAKALGVTGQAGIGAAQGAASLGAHTLGQTGDPVAATKAASIGAMAGPFNAIPGLKGAVAEALGMSVAQTGLDLADGTPLPDSAAGWAEYLGPNAAFAAIFRVPGAFSAKLKERGVEPTVADSLEKDMAGAFAARQNQSQSFPARPPSTPMPSDTYKAGQTAYDVSTPGEVRPSGTAAAGATTLGNSPRQSPAFEAKGTPVGKPVDDTPTGRLTAAIDEIIETKLSERGIQPSKEVIPSNVQEEGRQKAKVLTPQEFENVKPEPQLVPETADEVTPTDVAARPVAEMQSEAPVFKFKFLQNKYERILNTQGQEAADAFAAETAEPSSVKAVPEKTLPLQNAMEAGTTPDAEFMSTREKYAQIEGETDINKLREFARQNNIEEGINWTQPPAKIAHSIASHLSLADTMKSISKPKPPNPAKAASFDPQDFVDAIKRFTAKPRTVGKKKPRGTLREEKLVEKEKGQQSFLQQLNDTQAALDEGAMSIEEILDRGKSRLTSVTLDQLVKKGESHEVIDDAAAANIHVRSLVGDIFDLAKKTDKGQLKESDFQVIADKTIEKIHSLGKLSTDSARAVRLQAVTWSPEMMREIAQKLRDEGKGMTKRDRAAIEAMLNATTPESVATAYNRMKTPKLRDYVLEYYYNNLLSGAQTQTTNFLNTALWMHAQVPLRALEGGADMLQAIGRAAVGKKYTRQVYAREFLDLLHGYYTGGLKEGIRESKKAIRGLPTKLDSQIDRELLESAEAWSHPNAPRALRAAAPLIAWPSRLMKAADVLYKGMAAGGEAEAILTRWAKNEAKSTGVSMAEARKRVDALLNIDTANSKRLKAEIRKATEKFAQYATFNDAPNKLTQAILAGRTSTGIFGRLVIPFVNTTTNMLARSVELTPGLGAAKEAASRLPGIGQGGAITPQGFNNIAAKQIAGATILMSVAAMFDEDSLTAKGPTGNPAQREAWLKTHQPYSVKINGEWYNYSRLLGPLSAPIASAAIWFEEQKKRELAGKKELTDGKTEEEFASLADNIATYFFESSWANSLYSTFGYGKDVVDAGKRQVARTASGLVPWNSAFRSVLGTAAVMRGDETRRDSDDFWEYFRQQSPVVEAFTEKVPGKIDVLGKEVMQQGGVWKYWLPVAQQKPSTDPVEIEIGRVADATGYAPSWPSQFVDVEYEKSRNNWKSEKVKLDKEQYRKFAVEVGKEYNKRLAEMFKQKYYINADDEQKAQQIGNLHTDVSNEKRDAMLEEVKKQLATEGKVKLIKVNKFFNKARLVEKGE